MTDNVPQHRTATVVLWSSVFAVLAALVLLIASFVWGLRQRQQDLKTICSTMVYHRMIIREIVLLDTVRADPEFAQQYRDLLRLVPVLECRNGKPQLREAPQ